MARWIRRVAAGAAVAVGALALPAIAAPGDITTVAGGGVGDGLPATAAPLRIPRDVAVDPAGNAYIAEWDGYRVRRVDAATGVISTAAGNGSNKTYGDGGPAVDAGFRMPDEVELDAAGNLYILDWGAWVVRKVDAATGIVTNVPVGRSLFYPGAMVLDGGRGMYLEDKNQVVHVDLVTATATVVAGDGSYWNPSGDGGPATEASFDNINDLALDPAGNIYVTDNTRVRRIDAATGVITTVAGNGVPGFAGDGGPATEASFDFADSVVVGPAGELFISDRYNGRIRRVDAATGMISTFASDLAGAENLTFDPNGNLLVTISWGGVVLRVDPAGASSPFAGNGEWVRLGDGGPGPLAGTAYPTGLGTDAAGNVYFADTGTGRVRRVDRETGIITTVAGNGAWGYVEDPWPAPAPGDGGPATAASFADPLDVAVDAAGNLYVADLFNDRIRKVDAATGIITTVAGGGPGVLGDGGPAVLARLSFPTAVVVDGDGDLYIADSGQGRVRKVDATTGIITTVAGGAVCVFVWCAGTEDDGPGLLSFLSPIDLALDSVGNVYVADLGSEETAPRVRRVSPSGSITTVASNLPGLTSVATGPAGDLYIGQSTHVRRLRGGSLTTVAGGGTGGIGDGGPGPAARLDAVAGLAVGSHGDLFLSDAVTGRIRRVEAPIP